MEAVQGRRKVSATLKGLGLFSVIAQGACVIAMMLGTLIGIDQISEGWQFAFRTAAISLTILGIVCWVLVEQD